MLRAPLKLSIAASFRIVESRHLMLVLCFSLFSAVGCQSAGVATQASSAGPEFTQSSYNALVLNYETQDLGRLFSRVKKSRVASGLSSRFSFGEEKLIDEATPDGKWCQARVQIVYPHPDGSEDKGLARLIVSRNCSVSNSRPGLKSKMKNGFSKLMLQVSGSSPEFAELINSEESLAKMKTESVDEEIWQLNLPKEDLDILLSELSQRGFFEKQERPRGEARVSITVDQGELSKRWTSEPRLEDLMQQIYNEGELTAFNTQGAKIQTVSAFAHQADPFKG